MTAGSIAVPIIVPLRAPVAGKLKNVIDTCTPIELHTETPNAEIFFTIDGSKPDPFAALGADRNTIKYTKPFKLREGRKTVKAVALSRDGARESHIVTKCFEVEKCEGSATNQENQKQLAHKQQQQQQHRDQYEFIDELERERKKEIIKRRGILKKIVDTNNLSSFRSDGGSLSDNESSRYHKDTHYLDKRFGSKTLSFTTDMSQHSSPHSKSAATHYATRDDTIVGSKYTLPDSSVQALRLQRETDFLKCIYCFASRPQDPHARFCIECGKNLPPIPQAKLIPPESGQLGTCFYCKSTVPFNTSICVICENPINPQLQPQASIKLQGKIICSNCTTANPANYTTCVACDNKLIANYKVHPVDLALAVPQYPTAHGKSATCSQCFRINRTDARFCDWCGAKPHKNLEPLSCNRCGAHNHPYAKFCVGCGSLMSAPSNSNMNASNMSVGHTTPTWLASLDSKAAQILNKQYSTVSTQTYGLYYTSAKGMENKSEQLAKTSGSGGGAGSELVDRRAVLTTVSAGKGYWRQQMDHICSHLKAYAQSNSEFRVLVGEPKLGKINSAKVDMDASWCTITATYPIRNNATKDSFNASALIDRASANHAGHHQPHRLHHGAGSYLNNADYEMMAAAVAGRDSSLSEESVTEQEDSFRSDAFKSKKNKKRRPVEKNDEKLSGEDRQLLKELGKTGRGRAREVEYILKEGADPNAVTKEGLSVLHMAIRHRHFEAIPVLIERGADIKAKVPPKGNTVLHEAVLLGPEAESIIKMLLGFGASPSWKNAKNETPFDFAIKENNTAAVNVLGAQVGDNMIATYLKGKSNDIRP